MCRGRATPRVKAKKKNAQRETQKEMIIRDPVKIATDLLVPNEANPNKMTEKQLTKLCEQILNDGFHQPIMVVLREDGKYDIVSGHHRHKAAMQLGMAEVPCIVYEGGDDAKKAINMIRMNVVQGRMDPIKFMDLFDKYASEYGDDILEDMMGFADTGAFEEIKKQLKSGLPPAVAKKLNAMEKEKE